MRMIYVPDHDLTAFIGTIEDLCMDDRKPEPSPGGEFFLMVRDGDFPTLRDELDNRGISYRTD